MGRVIDLPTDLTPRVITGHVLDVLRGLPEGSIPLVVTSPPYWGLRAYGTHPQVWGGLPDHAHEWSPTLPRRERSADEGRGKLQAAHRGASYDAQGGEVCGCGSWKGELGAEPTPEAYVEHLGLVFDEVRRVLRIDGSVWLNLGDTYTTHPAGLLGAKRWKASTLANRDNTGAEQAGAFDKRTSGLREKNLVGIPWRVALDLQRRGWYLRSDCIWSKPNPMPESMKDRPTRAHEYVFLLTKHTKYFYDADAVRGSLAPSTLERAKGHYANPEDNPDTGSKWGPGQRRSYPVLTPAMRSLSPKYAPSTIRETLEGYDGQATKSYGGTGAQNPSDVKRSVIAGIKKRAEEGKPNGANLRTVWEITTQPYPGAHFATFPEALPERCILLSSRKGDTVLDPFAGSGTVLQVARALGRRSVGIELNPRYVKLARRRSGADLPDLEGVEIEGRKGST